MEERSKQIADLLKVLANENRPTMLCAPMKAPMPVNELSKSVPNI